MKTRSNLRADRGKWKVLQADQQWQKIKNLFIVIEEQDTKIPFCPILCSHVNHFFLQGPGSAQQSSLYITFSGAGGDRADTDSLAWQSL